MASIRFLGAAGTVTGSRFLVEAAGRRVLHHLERRLPEPSTTILLVGFQAVGSRGWEVHVPARLELAELG